MAYKPSKRVRLLFDEVEQIAEQLLELRRQEQRLRNVLERVWQTRTAAVATLGAKAAYASEVEASECAAYHEGRRGRGAKKRAPAQRGARKR